MRDLYLENLHNVFAPYWQFIAERDRLLRLREVGGSLTAAEAELLESAETIAAWKLYRCSRMWRRAEYLSRHPEARNQ